MIPITSGSSSRILRSKSSPLPPLVRLRSRIARSIFSFSKMCSAVSAAGASITSYPSLRASCTMIERISGSSSTISSRYGPRCCAVHEASLFATSFIAPSSGCGHFRSLLRAHRFLGGRQRNRDRGAAPDFAVDANRTLVRQDHPLAQRQPESHARACGLGGEEWVEYPLQMLARNANAVVDDLNENPPRFVGALSGPLILRDHFDHRAFGRRGVGGVEQQVEQHLLNFVVVGIRAPEIGSEDRFDADAAEAFVVGYQPQRLGDQPVDVDLLALRRGRPREIDQVLERARDARDLRQNGV